MKDHQKAKAESIKARLKYRAQKEGRLVQEVFTAYILERVLYRLSLSAYMDNFILKGGILLYGLLGAQYTRATTDIDLQGKNISNDAEKIKEAFRKILQITCDDGIRFDLDTLAAKNITGFKKYSGVNVFVRAYLDRTRIPVSIDIGYGDIIYPNKQIMEYPTLLHDEAPVLYAYSIESVISEKFEAIVSLGLFNSRYKDFYDICILSQTFDFIGKKLKKAIEETLAYRKTEIETIAIFDDGFANEPYRKGRWAGFLKSKNVQTDMTLAEAVMNIQHFLGPIVYSIYADSSMEQNWNHQIKEWIPAIPPYNSQSPEKEPAP